MTTIIGHPPSPTIPNSELEPNHTHHRVAGDPTKSSYIFQGSNLGLDSSHFPSEQPYFRPSILAHQELEHISGQSHFPPVHASYNFENYRGHTGQGGKHQSNVCTFFLTCCDYLEADNISSRETWHRTRCNSLRLVPNSTWGY